MPVGVDVIFGEVFVSVGCCDGLEATDEHDHGFAVVTSSDANSHPLVHVAE